MAAAGLSWSRATSVAHSINEARRRGPSEKQRSVAGGADSGSRDQRPQLQIFVRE